MSFAHAIGSPLSAASKISESTALRTIGGGESGLRLGRGIKFLCKRPIPEPRAPNSGVKAVAVSRNHWGALAPLHRPHYFVITASIDVPDSFSWIRNLDTSIAHCST